MTLLAMILLGIFIVLMTNQAGLVWKYVVALQANIVSSDIFPKATIVLCLRGPDPFLSDCIRALLHQNYPRYSVQIVVDSETDPAWAIAQNTLHQLKSDVNLDAVKIQVLRSPRSTCSLKCSALLQAMATLEPDCEVVALIDADTIAQPNWLQDLVAPLNDPQVGITTGGRWYAPIDDQWGTLHRFIWNAFASLSMYHNKTPWGGTLAFRTALLQTVNLEELWGNALCEDVPLRQAALNQSLDIQFVPSLMMINQEEIQFSSFLGWASRQMLLTRLYHSNWAKLAFDVLFTPLLAMVAVGLLIVSLKNQQGEAAMFLSAALIVFYVFCTLIPVMIMDYSVRQRAIARGISFPSHNPKFTLKVLVSLFSSYFTGISTLILALSSNHVKWRGITYDIKDAKSVYLLKYFPYSSESESFTPKSSI
jgi:cellulose synthase/poly-beta-1,6-N-acetylglucosamine synthase-like glycosyltransferase